MQESRRVISSLLLSLNSSTKDAIVKNCDAYSTYFCSSFPLFEASMDLNAKQKIKGEKKELAAAAFFLAAMFVHFPARGRTSDQGGDEHGTRPLRVEPATCMTRRQGGKRT